MQFFSHSKLITIKLLYQIVPQVLFPTAFLKPDLYSLLWEVTHEPGGKLISPKSPGGFYLLCCCGTGPPINSRFALPVLKAGNRRRGDPDHTLVPVKGFFLLRSNTGEASHQRGGEGQSHHFIKKHLPMFAIISSQLHTAPCFKSPPLNTVVLGTHFQHMGFVGHMQTKAAGFRNSSQLHRRSLLMKQLSHPALTLTTAEKQIPD